MARSFSNVYRLLVRAQIRTARLVGLATLAGITVLLGVAIRGATDPLESGTQMVSNFGLAVVVPVGALLIATSSLGDLVDDRSLVYVLATPVHRAVVALAAWAASVTVVVPATSLGLALAAVVIGEPDLVVGAVVAAGVGALAYCGIFVLIGVTMRRALVWGLVYILIWEGFVANAGSGLARLAIRSYTRSLLSQQTGVDLRLADRSTAASLLVPLLVVVASIALVWRHLDRREIE